MDLEELYQQLRKKTNPYIGELILVRKEQEETGSGGLPPKAYFTPEDIGTRNTLELGVLNSGLELNTDIGIIVPTKEHIKKREYHDEWELEKGPITIHWFEVFDGLREKVPRREIPYVPGVPETQLQSALWVYTGEEVAQYFNKEETDPDYINSDYMKALELLKVQIPRDLAIKYSLQTMKYD